MKPVLSFVIVGALLVLPAASTWGQSQDRVVTTSNQTYLGEVTTVTHNEVNVETRSGTRTVKVTELDKINFGGEPRELRLGRDAALRQAYARAKEDFGKLQPADVGEGLIRQDLEFYMAWSEAELGLSGGDKANGATMLMKFVEDHPNSYHYYNAVMTLGKLAAALGHHERAVEYYQKYSEAPFPGHKLRASLAIAGSLRVQGDIEKALKECEKVSNIALDSPEVVKQKKIANVVKAACLAELGKPEEGLKIIEQVLKETSAEGSPTLYAFAYNAKGDCNRKLNKPQQALLDYLHTDLLFNQDSEAHAEALFHLSTLWREVAKNTERSLRATTILRSRYAGSRWAKNNSDE